MTIPIFGRTLPLGCLLTLDIGCFVVMVTEVTAGVGMEATVFGGDAPLPKTDDLTDTDVVPDVDLVAMTTVLSAEVTLAPLYS